MSDDQAIRFALPWPPSVNHYWLKSVRPIKRASPWAKLLPPSVAAGASGSCVHVRLSAQGKAYRAVAVLLTRRLMARQRIDQLCGPLQLELHCFPRDEHVRDVDNYQKGLLDALSHAGLWADDSQVKHLRVTHWPVDPDPRIVISCDRWAATCPPAYTTLRIAA
jgi:crossover junction endodeoxyribonuclease RusA